MGIFSSKAPSPHNNVFGKVAPKSNLGAIPNWKQTTGTLPGHTPVVEIPHTGGYFGNPKAKLNSYPSIFSVTD